ncbi:hypothetical protein [Mucilaginibacter sp.]|jgi:hypothetical protein|uniref:hypothetical protein n=1 Tax=Mucilaginibacter sp. TaxID=1882438 RepID=UPI003565C5F4
MTRIGDYFNLLSDIQVSDYRISFLPKFPNEAQELVLEHERNASLKMQLQEIEKELHQPTKEGELIRSGFIYISNGLLNSFRNISKWGGYFPDLGQGMVIRGYLFGKILNDYSTALKSEGNYFPIANIYMSTVSWNASLLEKVIINIFNKLNDSNFQSKMDAINFYDQFRESMLIIIQGLKEDGVI